MRYLTPDVAAAAGMSLAQLQQFCAGAFTPAPDQIGQLARRMGVKQWRMKSSQPAPMFCGRMVAIRIKTINYAGLARSPYHV
jgi:hypothetical protein